MFEKLFSRDREPLEKEVVYADGVHPGYEYVIDIAQKHPNAVLGGYPRRGTVVLSKTGKVYVVQQALVFTTNAPANIQTWYMGKGKRLFDKVNNPFDLEGKVIESFDIAREDIDDNTYVDQVYDNTIEKLKAA